MVKAYLSLGSNIGNSYKYINSAIELIKKNNIAISAISPFYTTEPWGKEDQNDFLNCVIEIKTIITPWELLKIFQGIEIELGKDIKVRWGERTIDIDIILFGNKIIYENNLIIPHLRYQKRNFVLIPLCDISKYIIDPLNRLTSGELLQNIKDTNKVKIFNEN